MLGKRKRDKTVLRRNPAAGITETAPIKHPLFKHHFESRFKPLPEEQLAIPSLIEKQIHSDDSTLNDSEWSGFSEAEDLTARVEVVDHARHLVADPDDHRLSGLKSFMSSRPPREKGEPPKPDIHVLEMDDSETVNLKHDLDLQRLLKESHLLEQAKSSLDLGINRHKATNLRLHSLSSKMTLFGQEKMPMSHRRGITAKSEAKEALRRKQARENGVVLEKLKPTIPSAPSQTRRERAVDMPSLGKFKGGTLKLSRKDIASIQGPKRSIRVTRRVR